MFFSSFLIITSPNALIFSSMFFIALPLFQTDFSNKKGTQMDSFIFLPDKQYVCIKFKYHSQHFRPLIQHQNALNPPLPELHNQVPYEHVF